MRTRSVVFAAAAIIAASLVPLRGQRPVDHPSVTVDGRTYTPASILARNMGSAEDQETAFPPHKTCHEAWRQGTSD